MTELRGAAAVAARTAIENSQHWTLAAWNDLKDSGVALFRGPDVLQLQYCAIDHDRDTTCFMKPDEALQWAMVRGIEDQAFTEDDINNTLVRFDVQIPATVLRTIQKEIGIQDAQALEEALKDYAAGTVTECTQD